MFWMRLGYRSSVLSSLFWFDVNKNYFGPIKMHITLTKGCRVITKKKKKYVAVVMLVIFLISV